LLIVQVLELLQKKLTNFMIQKGNYKILKIHLFL